MKWTYLSIMLAWMVQFRQLRFEIQELNRNFTIIEQVHLTPLSILHNKEEKKWYILSQVKQGF